MGPADLDALLCVLRKHNVAHYEDREVILKLGPAPVPSGPVEVPADDPQTAALAAITDLAGRMAQP